MRTVVVLLLAIALFVWFLSQANLGEVWRHIREARLGLLAAALACGGLSFWVRAVRWQHMLAPIGPTRFRTVFRSTVIGFAALGLLPARAGDVLRPYLVARQERLSATATFATIVMERVLDLLTVLVLLAVFVWGFPAAAALPSALLQPIKVSVALVVLVVVAAMLVMWALASHPERVGGLVFGAARILPPGIARRLASLAHTFSSGFAMARQPRALGVALLWSLPLWLVGAAQVWFATAAFGIDVPFVGTFLLMGLLVIGVAVPTPGSVGSFHEAYRIGVTAFFGASDEAAVAAGIVLHAIAFVPVVLVGVLFMAQDGLSISRLRALAGTAGEKEVSDTHEMPVLRPSGR